MCEEAADLAIAAGTFLDGVPEGVVLGLSVLNQGAPGVGTVTAFPLSSLAEDSRECDLERDISP